MTVPQIVVSLDFSKISDLSRESIREIGNAKFGKSIKISELKVSMKDIINHPIILSLPAKKISINLIHDNISQESLHNFIEIFEAYYR